MLPPALTTKRASSPAPAATVLVTNEHPEGRYSARVLRARAHTFLDALGLQGELSLVVTTDAAIRDLNRDWRGKDKPTDVLSFPQEPSLGLLGDVVISLDTARRQAAERSAALSDELARLLAHGLLHLLGHDHENDADARRMAQAEVKLLGRVGLVGEALAHHPAELEFTRASRARRPGRASTKEKP